MELRKNSAPDGFKYKTLEEALNDLERAPLVIGPFEERVYIPYESNNFYGKIMKSERGKSTIGQLEIELPIYSEVGMEKKPYTYNCLLEVEYAPEDPLYKVKVSIKPRNLKILEKAYNSREDFEKFVKGIISKYCAVGGSDSFVTGLPHEFF